jgi:hypothetical protein
MQCIKFYVSEGVIVSCLCLYFHWVHKSTEDYLDPFNDFMYLYNTICLIMVLIPCDV